MRQGLRDATWERRHVLSCKLDPGAGSPGPSPSRPRGLPHPGDVQATGSCTASAHRLLRRDPSLPSPPHFSTTPSLSAPSPIFTLIVFSHILSISLRHVFYPLIYIPLSPRPPHSEIVSLPPLPSTNSPVLTSCTSQTRVDCHSQAEHDAPVYLRLVCLTSAAAQLCHSPVQVSW